MSETRQMVIELDTGRRRPIRQAKPLVSSSAAGWTGFQLEECCNYENELHGVYGIDHVIVLQVDAPLSLQFKGDGQCVEKTIAPGQISVVPANLPLSVRTQTTGRVIVVSLEQRMVMCAAAELGIEHINLKCVHGINDPLIRELVLGLRTEATENSGKLYPECLANTLATHIVHRYSHDQRSAPEAGRGLSKPALRRVVEFINDRLAEDLSLSEIAAVANLSAFHFSRLFKQSTRCSPHEFVIRCRVERAKSLLMQSRNITDVALEVGFCDQSHLARHFRRVFGLTPGSFVRQIGRSKQHLSTK